MRMASATTDSGPRSPAAHAFHATASSDDTPTSGTSSADAMPFAVAIAMRTPVNDPGPRPTATHAMSSRATPCSANAASMRGSSWVFDARRASASTEAVNSIIRDDACSTPNPIAMISLAVSKASTYRARSDAPSGRKFMSLTQFLPRTSSAAISNPSPTRTATDVHGRRKRGSARSGCPRRPP